ncbi:MAG: hypothetical protein ACE5KE_12710 [Methanosarcinales archaeon]
MVFKAFLVITVLSVLIVFIAYFLLLMFKPSSVGVYHCVCDVPGYGEKEAIVTVQVEGENWGAKVIYPTNITLNIFGYSVPCSCKTV